MLREWKPVTSLEGQRNDAMVSKQLVVQLEIFEPDLTF